MLQRIAKAAGITLGSHAMRAGFAARVRADGMDLGATMTLLGHKSPVMTLRYSEAGENDGALNAFHAIEGNAPKPMKKRAN